MEIWYQCVGKSSGWWANNKLVENAGKCQVLSKIVEMQLSAVEMIEYD